jgi:hypothetical protein
MSLIVREIKAKTILSRSGIPGYVYERYRLQKWLDRDFTDNIIKRLKRGFDRKP